jgi:hypothetical protein
MAQLCSTDHGSKPELDGRPELRFLPIYSDAVASGDR